MNKLNHQNNQPVSSEDNGWAIAGFVCSIFLTPLGLVFSIIGLKKSKEIGKGRGLSIAGIVISSTLIVLVILLIMLVMFIALSVTDTLRTNSRDNVRLSDIGVVATGIVDYVDENGSAPVGVINKDENSIQISNSDLNQYSVSSINSVAVLPPGIEAQSIPVLAKPDVANNTLLAMNVAENANEGTIRVNVDGLNTTFNALPNEDQLVIISNARCAGDNKNKVTTHGAGFMSIAILYKLEKHNVPQCWQAVV